MCQLKHQLVPSQSYVERISRALTISKIGHAHILRNCFDAAISVATGRHGGRRWYNGEKESLCPLSYVSKRQGQE